MKATILGAQHTDVHQTEHAILTRAGTQGFQRMAGYVPTKMPNDKLTMTPIQNDFIVLAPMYMRIMCRNIMHSYSPQVTHNHNPRIPYLLLAWLLIGTENPYRLNLYVSDDTVLRQVAALLIRIAVWDLPDYSYCQLQFSKYLYSKRIISSESNAVEATIHEVARFLALTIYSVLASDSTHEKTWFVKAMIRCKKFMSLDAKTAIGICARNWHFLSDEEMCLVIRSLMLDILLPERSIS